MQDDQNERMNGGLMRTPGRAALTPNWMQVRTPSYLKVNMSNLNCQRIKTMDSPSSENAIDTVMESPASDIKPVASFQLFTKAERIKQLNDIDKVQCVSICIRSRSNLYRASPGCCTQQDWL